MDQLRNRVVWEAEGVESSIAIVCDDSLSFFVNGKSDGNAIGDASTQIMLGMVGAALHPEPRQALVVGLGTGETAGWLAASNGGLRGPTGQDLFWPALLLLAAVVFFFRQVRA